MPLKRGSPQRLSLLLLLMVCNVFATVPTTSKSSSSGNMIAETIHIKESEPGCDSVGLFLTLSAFCILWVWGNIGKLCTTIPSLAVVCSWTSHDMLPTPLPILLNTLCLRSNLRGLVCLWISIPSIPFHYQSSSGSVVKPVTRIKGIQGQTESWPSYHKPTHSWMVYYLFPALFQNEQELGGGLGGIVANSILWWDLWVYQWSSVVGTEEALGPICLFILW